MEVKNKKVVFLGDSITEGSGASSFENSYTQVFARISGADVFVDGIGGTRIARQRAASENPRHDLDFNMRAEKLPECADLVVVFGGTNDFGHGDAPLGDFNDRDVYTFYGALHSLITTLLNRYPTSRIVFMTPLHRLEELDTVNRFGRERGTLSLYVNVIREICEYYSIPILDLFSVSGLQPKVDIIREKYMPDGLHPSDLGAERIANMLLAFLKTI